MTSHWLLLPWEASLHTIKRQGRSLIRLPFKSLHLSHTVTMLHFLGFLEFIVAIVGILKGLHDTDFILVFALGLSLNLAPNTFTGWPAALVLLMVAVSLSLSKFLIVV